MKQCRSTVNLVIHKKIIMPIHSFYTLSFCTMSEHLKNLNFRISSILRILKVTYPFSVMAAIKILEKSHIKLSCNCLFCEVS